MASSDNAKTQRRDFYVELNCCTSCGVPQSIAADLVGWINEDALTVCYWIKLDRAIKILQAQNWAVIATPAPIRQSFVNCRGQNATITTRNLRHFE